MSKNMKASGTNYLREIPSTWNAKRMKYCAEICNGAEYADIVVDEGGFPVMGSGGEFARASKYCYSDRSVLLGRKGTIDKPLFIEEPFWCVDTMFYTKMNKGINAKYLYYCSLNIRFDFYVTSTALPSMTQRDLGSEKIAIPPLPEQTIIADFLDEQCEKIDNIATDLEKQIEILQKYKKSLITETVTKGLDKSVAMKTSGIEWIGDIPEHYSLVPLKNLFWMYAGGDVNECDFSDERTEKYRYAIYSNSLENNGIFGYMSKYRFKGDTITVTGRGDVGKALPRYDAYYPIVRLLVCVPQKKLSVSFFSYCINCADILGDQTAMAQLTTQKLGVIKVPVPAYEEQTKIANYLDSKCLKIDSIIESKKEQLTKITQHKKSLIYEYVTGKRRVKGAHNNGN